jgi:hypothetical protein
MCLGGGCRFPRWPKYDDDKISGRVAFSLFCILLRLSLENYGAVNFRLLYRGILFLYLAYY